MRICSFITLRYEDLAVKYGTDRDLYKQLRQKLRVNNQKYGVYYNSTCSLVSALQQHSKLSSSKATSSCQSMDPFDITIHETGLQSLQKASSGGP